MDIVEFHKNLLGGEPTPIQKAFYDGFSKGYRGLWVLDTSDPRVENETTLKCKFYAALVVALFQTKGDDGEMHPVAVVMPKRFDGWAEEQTRELARLIFKSRKGNIQAVLVLREAFQQLRFATRILQIHEPSHWVGFGFEKGDISLPNWLSSRFFHG